MTPWCFLANKVFKRGIKNADFLNKSFSLKTVICPRKILEKSLKFVCLKLYEPCYLISYPSCYHVPDFLLHYHVPHLASQCYKHLHLVFITLQDDTCISISFQLVAFKLSTSIDKSALASAVLIDFGSFNLSSKKFSFIDSTAISWSMYRSP